LQALQGVPNPRKKKALLRRERGGRFLRGHFRDRIEHSGGKEGEVHHRRFDTVTEGAVWGKEQKSARNKGPVLEPIPLSAKEKRRGPPTLELREEHTSMKREGGRPSFRGREYTFQPEGRLPRGGRAERQKRSSFQLYEAPRGKKIHLLTKLREGKRGGRRNPPFTKGRLPLYPPQEDGKSSRLDEERIGELRRRKGKSTL